MAPPFPLCCLTGLISKDAAATAAAFLSGLTAGGAVTALSQISPLYKDPKAPLPELLADHKKRTVHSRKVQKQLVMGGLVAAAAAAGLNSSKEAAVPLCLSAALSAGSVALTILFVYPLNEKIEAAAASAPLASPSKGKNKGPSAEEEAATRAQLQSYAKLSAARTAISALAFGAAICGVLLLGKGK